MAARLYRETELGPEKESLQGFPGSNNGKNK